MQSFENFSSYEQRLNDKIIDKQLEVWNLASKIDALRNYQKAEVMFVDPTFIIGYLFIPFSLSSMVELIAWIREPKESIPRQSSVTLLAIGLGIMAAYFVMRYGGVLPF